MDSHGNTLVPFKPKSTSDTLMACFCLYFYGREQHKDRMQMRRRLVNHFKNTIFYEETFDVRPDLGQIGLVRAFVNRLHKMYPNEIHQSANVFTVENPKRFKKEAISFIQKHQTEGFIFDKVTFCYILADLFNVHVVIYQPEEIFVSSDRLKELEYTLYLRHDRGFELLVPSKRYARHEYDPPVGLQTQKSMQSLSLFELNGHPFFPPSIIGYRMHTCEHRTEEEKIYRITGTWSDVTLYVFDETFTLLTCVSKRGKADPHFFGTGSNRIYVIFAKSLEDAKQAVQIESATDLFSQIH
jgi:hypothetical protein